MGRKKQKSEINEHSTKEFNIDPFANLDIPSDLNLKEFQGETKPTEKDRPISGSKLYVRLEKKGRGGKVVTVISGFEKTAAEKLESIAKDLRKQIGTGGTCYEDTIELQGDHRNQAGKWLIQKGYKLKGEVN